YGIGRYGRFTDTVTDNPKGAGSVIVQSGGACSVHFQYFQIIQGQVGNDAISSIDGQELQRTVFILFEEVGVYPILVEVGNVCSDVVPLLQIEVDAVMVIIHHLHFRTVQQIGSASCRIT